MREQKVAKVTISLPKKLLNLADRLAGERSMTRSGVIAQLLQEEEEAQIQALMEEGYCDMSEENRRLAEESFQLASEILRKSTRWEEHANG